MSLDSRAGLEDTGREGFSGPAHAIVAVDPTAASVELASDPRDMVKEKKGASLPATRPPSSPM